MDLSTELDEGALLIYEESLHQLLSCTMTVKCSICSSMCHITFGKVGTAMELLWVCANFEYFLSNTGCYKKCTRSIVHPMYTIVSSIEVNLHNIL